METLLIIGLMVSLLINAYLCKKVVDLHEDLESLKSLVYQINKCSLNDGRRIHKLTVYTRDTMDCLLDTMKLVIEMHDRLF